MIIRDFYIYLPFGIKIKIPIFVAYRMFFKFHLIVDVEESIVNALSKLQITDQLFKSYVLHEWCVHNRLFNAYYEVKFKKTPDTR
jgi:hypothetical protein